MSEQATCPYCGSEHCDPYKHYTTHQNGNRLLFQCSACKKIFSEASIIVPASRAASFRPGRRNPGQGRQPLGRRRLAEYSGLAGTTIKAFSETKGTFLEGLRKPISFIATVLRTRTEGMGLNATCRALAIAKNTLLLWERRLAGKKRTLLLYALMHTFISQIIEGDELYTKIGKNVPVADCEGVKVRLKNKGNRKQQAGPPRAKYEASHPEHPDTCQDITPNAIQANRLEATNASIRRRNSTY